MGGLRVLRGAGVPAGGAVPRFSGSESVLLATGILGATAMPHVIYLHSSLTSAHTRGPGGPAGLAGPAGAVDERRSLVHSVRRGAMVGLGPAGVAHAAMLVIAARLFHPSGRPADTIDDVHTGIGATLGRGAALAFALVPLILLTPDRRVMGPLANRPLLTAAASVVAALVIGLNFHLVGQVLTG
ncbi:divalent metal cation transporter [Streptomyces sp. NPDC032472]|uniref:divalent metal cation transporter n=1 Tax=Streptomyces sp. NPDC032472 TaxID=3155018 RepID=UPI0033D66996